MSIGNRPIVEDYQLSIAVPLDRDIFVELSDGSIHTVSSNDWYRINEQVDAYMNNTAYMVHMRWTAAFYTIIDGVLDMYDDWNGFDDYQ
jgi:hypothetical protein